MYNCNTRNHKFEFHNSNKEGENILKMFDLSSSSDEEVFKTRLNTQNSKPRNSYKFRTDRIFYDGNYLSEQMTRTSKFEPRGELKYFSNRKYDERNRLE